jgi:hypothetical protein
MAYYTRYSGDPYKLNVKYSGNCARCNARIARGQSAYYWPRERRLYCVSCGEPLYREFVAMAVDEDLYRQGYGI